MSTHVPAAPPVHMNRERFSPATELTAIATAQGLARTTTPFGTAWLATHHEDVRAVLANSTAFSTSGLARWRRPQSPVGDDVPEQDTSGILVSYDPPEHTRLRRMLAPEFTIRRMRRIEPRVNDIITDHLDAMEKAGPPADLVTAFALPVPSLMICELLGVPYSDHEVFQRRTAIQLDFTVSVEERVRAANHLREYMNELVDRQRAEPGDDILGRLVHDHGDELTKAELSGIAQLLLLAGHETTSNMLGMGTLLLLENPDQLAMLRDNPNAVNDAVEELLRYLSVVHSGLARTALTDITIGGQTVAEGEPVLCSLPMANRDPAFTAEGDRLDLTREPGPHLAFGHGIHHCLGAPLARMEMRIGFPALLRRFPSLRLAIASDEVEFRRFTPVHGVRCLPVTW
jgi:cytochrome P450